MTTWNPADKAASITLSGGDLVATQGGSTFNAVRGTTSKPTSGGGKWYFEVVVTTLDAFVGVATSSANLSSYVGSDAHGWGVWSSNDTAYNSGSTQGATPLPIAAGTNVGVLLDLDAGTLQFRYDGALGTSPPTYTLGLTGNVFPAAGFGNSSSGAVTGKFTAADCTYSPPAGFTVWQAASAPVVSSPVVVSTGNTIATVRVTTDTAPSGSSTLAVQVLPAGDATPTAAAILASPTQTITSGASGARDFNLTSLTNGTACRAHFAQTGPSNVVSTSSFTPSTVPGAPTIGTAVAGNAQATVAGTAPASNGGATITGYRSTATPGGSTVTGASLPITHTGLSNGTGYTFTLAAQNANGYGAESAASNSVTPAAPGTAPTITVQPSNQTVTAGATAGFSVTATGSALTYQWRRNGTNIGGATSSSYTTPATTVSGGSANNGDLYSVVVTGDTAPAATSSNATLTVNAATGTTLEEVMTDSTGASIRLNQTTRVCLEPFTTIEALFTGSRTVVTGTTDPTTGRFVVPSGTVPPGKYAMFQLLPSTGAPAALQGAAFDIIDVV